MIYDGADGITRPWPARRIWSSVRVSKHVCSFLLSSVFFDYRNFDSVNQPFLNAGIFHYWFLGWPPYNICNSFTWNSPRGNKNILFNFFITNKNILLVHFGAVLSFPTRKLMSEIFPNIDWWFCHSFEVWIQTTGRSMGTGELLCTLIQSASANQFYSI
jgi:hypothetical protein